MAKREEILRTNITWIDTIAILAAAVVGRVQGNFGSAVLCGAAMAAAIGVWRGVRFLGKMLEYTQASVQEQYESGYQQGWEGTPDH